MPPADGEAGGFNAVQKLLTKLPARHASNQDAGNQDAGNQDAGNKGQNHGPMSTRILDWLVTLNRHP
jgi:hypothetical protein